MVERGKPLQKTSRPTDLARGSAGDIEEDRIMAIWQELCSGRPRGGKAALRPVAVGAFDPGRPAAVSAVSPHRDATSGTGGRHATVTLGKWR